MEEFSRGFDIRILQVSISLGTKFQRNRLGRFWAPASLRKGVDVSAISSVQTVWWDWSWLAFAGVTPPFFFLSANNFCAETVCMKASHHNFKTKQQAVEGDETCVCFASFGPRSLRIGLQRVSKPSTTTLKLTKATQCTSPGPTEFAHFKISSNIMPIVIFGHMAPSSCVWTKLTRPVHSAHEDPNRRRKEANRPSSISGTDVGMYANEPLSGSKSKPLGAVKSALSHGDGDKRFSKPLDFDLL